MNDNCSDDFFLNHKIQNFLIKQVSSSKLPLDSEYKKSLECCLALCLGDADPCNEAVKSEFHMLKFFIEFLKLDIHDRRRVEYLLDPVDKYR